MFAKKEIIPTIHFVRDYTFLVGDPKITWCGIELLRLSRKDRKRVYLTDEVDDVTCARCANRMTGSGFVDWLFGVVFGR